MLVKIPRQRKRELVAIDGFPLCCCRLKSQIITTIPTYNSDRFLEQTLESVARQTLRPDRVIVLDDLSSDRTEDIVRSFKGIHCEFTPNLTRLGLFGNFNRCLDFASETEFLQILHADDTLEPEFYAMMTDMLKDCHGQGMAWCLDERIDEFDRHLSLSGKADGKIEVLTRDAFLQLKAELGNQAFCATLLRTSKKNVPCRFREDFPIMGDTVFWAAFGAQCEKRAHVHLSLAKYRWHGGNQTVFLGPNIESLILDEWRTMQMNESLRSKPTGFFRMLKLKGLFAVRSGIKAKRVRQNGDPEYSREIVKAAGGITGRPLWIAGKVLVELRDFYLFKIQRRPRHPKNIYS